jgi:hypothetical protein
VGAESEQPFEPIDGLLVADLGPARAPAGLDGEALARAVRLATRLAPRPFLVVVEGAAARPPTLDALAEAARARLVEAGVPADRVTPLAMTGEGAPRVSLRFAGYPLARER